MVPVARLASSIIPGRAVIRTVRDLPNGTDVNGGDGSDFAGQSGSSRSAARLDRNWPGVMPVALLNSEKNVLLV